MSFLENVQSKLMDPAENQPKFGGRLIWCRCWQPCACLCVHCMYAGVKACLLISCVLGQTVLCEQKMAKTKINKDKTKRV